MKKKSLMDEQREIIQKFLSGVELDYVECIIAYGVLTVMREHLLNQFAKFTSESEEDD